MSEMASTLKDKWGQITQYKGTVLTTTFVNQLKTFCAPITSALRRLHNKDRYCHDLPDKDDILDVIEAIHKDDQTEALFTEAFNACAPILMMAIHMLVFNCLLHDPEVFVDQSVKNATLDSLYTNPTKQAVNQYLIDAILQKRRTIQRSDNLWDRSLYNAASDTPPKQCNSMRGHHLDQEEDDICTPGTSGSSNVEETRFYPAGLCETSTTIRQQPGSETPQTGCQKSVPVPVSGRQL